MVGDAHILELDGLLQKIIDACREGVEIGEQSAIAQILAEKLYELVSDKRNEIKRSNAVMHLMRAVIDALTFVQLPASTSEDLERARQALDRSKRVEHYLGEGDPGDADWEQAGWDSPAGLR